MVLLYTTSSSMARFNMHSAAVAVLSDLLAQRLPVEYPEGAFVAGLLHDAGRLLIAFALPEEYERILEIYSAGDRSLMECERNILGFTHAELSAEALNNWKLPEKIRIAVGDHHLSPAKSNVGIPLSNVVDAANQYANSTGSPILVNNTDAADVSKVELLGLDAEELRTDRRQHR